MSSSPSNPKPEIPLDSRRIEVSLRLEEALQKARHVCTHAQRVYLSAKLQVQLKPLHPTNPTQAMLDYHVSQQMAQTLLDRVRAHPTPKD